MKSKLLFPVIAVCLIFVGSGCGPSLEKTEIKVVGADGNPVSGAMVTLVSESDTSVTPSGQTNSSGVATISTNGKAGAPKGTYKALVTKSAAIAGPSDTSDPAKVMAEMAQKNLGTQNRGGPANRQGPGGPGSMGGKNELPAKYGDAKQTPFTVTVPSSGVVELKLDK